MKILYYFPERNTPMQKWQRIHIFDELRRHGVEIDAFNPLIYESLDEAHEELVKIIRKKNFDLFFTDCCNERKILKDTILEIKRMGLPTLAIRFDNLVIPFEDKDLAPLFDLLWLTAKETRYFYDRWNVNYFFAPYAANPYLFNFNQPDSYNRHICFIGTPYGSRAIMMNTLTSSGINTDVFYKNQNDSLYSNPDEGLKLQLKKMGRFEMYSNWIRFHQGRKLIMGRLLNAVHGQSSIIENEYLHAYPVVDPEDQSVHYSHYALALASTSTNHTDILREPLKIINLRNFEIPMSGGIELCKYNPELAEYFEEGKEILFYRSEEELIDKSRYYTESATDRELTDIKIAARRRAENEHTWWNRFSIAFSELGIG